VASRATKPPESCSALAGKQSTINCLLWILEFDTVNRSTRVNLALVSGRQFVGKQFWKFSDSLLAVAPGIGIAENRFWGGEPVPRKLDRFSFAWLGAQDSVSLWSSPGLWQGLPGLWQGSRSSQLGARAEHDASGLVAPGTTRATL